MLRRGLSQSGVENQFCLLLFFGLVFFQARDP